MCIRDRLRQDDVPETGIGKNFALLWAATTGHWTVPFLFSLIRNGSGAYSLLGLLGTLGAVLRTALLAVLDALGVENAAKHVIADARKVAHTSATDQHDAVL